MKNIGKEGLDTALGKLSKHTWQWAKSNLRMNTLLGVGKAFGGSKITNYGLNSVIYVCDTLAEAAN